MSVYSLHTSHPCGLGDRKALRQEIQSAIDAEFASHTNLTFDAELKLAIKPIAAQFQEKVCKASELIETISSKSDEFTQKLEKAFSVSTGKKTKVSFSNAFVNKISTILREVIDTFKKELNNFKAKESTPAPMPNKKIQECINSFKDQMLQKTTLKCNRKTKNMMDEMSKYNQSYTVYANSTYMDYLSEIRRKVDASEVDVNKQDVCKKDVSTQKECKKASMVDLNSIKSSLSKISIQEDDEDLIALF